MADGPARTAPQGWGDDAWEARRRALIPVLIALTSVLGAIGAWRASAASGAAAAAERRAFSNTVDAEQMRTIIESGLGRIEFSYARALALYVSAGVLRDEAATAGTGQQRLLSLAAAQEAEAGSYWIDAGAVGPDGSLDLEAKREADWTAAAYTQDLDPEPEMARAAALRSTSQRLVGLTAFFIAAALFFTLAEVTRSTRAGALYWLGGASVLVVSTALLVIVEVM